MDIIVHKRTTAALLCRQMVALRHTAMKSGNPPPAWIAQAAILIDMLTRYHSETSPAPEQNVIDAIIDAYHTMGSQCVMDDQPSTHRLTHYEQSKLQELRANLRRSLTALLANELLTDDLAMFIGGTIQSITGVLAREIATQFEVALLRYSAECVIDQVPSLRQEAS